MIICYYTENEKITYCHDGGGKTYEELKALSDEWNSKETKKVHIVEVEDNSLTAYLFTKLNEKRKCDKEKIYDIQRVLSDLDDMIRDLIRRE